MRRRLLLAAPGIALAQAGAIRVLCPYAPGGAADLLGRLAAQAISEALSVPVVVENRTGAGGNLAAEQVARAAPDGSTLLVMAAAHAANASLYRNLPFSVLRDFAPVAVVGLVPNLLSVHPSVPARSVAEFLAFARTQPRGITYASPGIGTVGHLAMEMLRGQAGFDATHVPFRGTAPALTELVAGRIQAMLDNLPPQSEQLRAGGVRGIAVSTARRLPAWSDLPTMAETLPGFEAVAWQSIVAPAGTPRPLLETMSRAILTATAAQAQRLRGLGIEPGEMGVDAFPGFLRAEVEKWGAAVRLSGASAE